jgi:LacI family transcriptional regulator
MLVDHLVELGHSRVFYVGGPPQWISSRNRERATKAALRGHGLAPVGTAHGDWSPESGYRAAAAIPSDGAVTAVIVANDQMALGVMRALEDRGMSVPDDVSVTGFDDIAESRFFRPGLTTVRPDFDSQGRAAFRRLLRLIGEDTPEAPLVIDVSVQLRASTGSARA